jgi:uncharacterized protein
VTQPIRYSTKSLRVGGASDAGCEGVVATWPEYAVCVAARLALSGAIEICAPHGLDDLLDGVWRRNPARVTVGESERRLARKQPASRWPGVRLID